MPKPVRHAVAIAITNEKGELLIIKRPETDQELGGLWGLPALARDPSENQYSVAEQVGPRKLGVTVAIGKKIGEQVMDRGGYILRLADYAGTIVEGTPSVPQPDETIVQYTDVKYTSDPTVLCISALKGSVCSRVYLASIGINWKGTTR